MCHTPLQEDTWPEVVRRVLALWVAALRVKAADASGGLDKAVGLPGHSNAHPLARLDFLGVLQVCCCLVTAFRNFLLA